MARFNFDDRVWVERRGVGRTERYVGRVSHVYAAEVGDDSGIVQRYEIQTNLGRIFTANESDLQPYPEIRSRSPNPQFKVGDRVAVAKQTLSVSGVISHVCMDSTSFYYGIEGMCGVFREDEIALECVSEPSPGIGCGVAIVASFKDAR